jgi:hypothetical protein
VSRETVQWEAIVCITAFKRDLVTTDEIILAFEVGERPSVVKAISEEWTGFADLFSPLSEQFGISPTWYLEIMTPAFAPTPRVLYDRRPTASAP